MAGQEPVRRVEDIETYWLAPPPEESPRVAMWRMRIAGGWRPNKRIRSFGYYEAAKYFGVYIWEYVHVIFPLIKNL